MKLFNVLFFLVEHNLRAFGICHSEARPAPPKETKVLTLESSIQNPPRCNTQMPFPFSGTSASSWIKCEKVSLRVERPPLPPLSSGSLRHLQQDRQTPFLAMALPTYEEDHRALSRWLNGDSSCSWPSREFWVESFGVLDMKPWQNVLLFLSMLCLINSYS